MNLLNLIRTPKDETADTLVGLADRLLPKRRPACVATLDDAYALRRDLQVLDDSATISQATHAAIRDRLRRLDAVIPRLQTAARMRASASRLAEDRAIHTAAVEASTVELASADRRLADVSAQLERVEARLAALNAESEARRAAEVAEFNALEGQVLAAIQAGDEKAEQAASDQLASLTAHRSGDAGLQVRIDQTQRVRDGLAADRDARAAERALAAQRLHGAALEVASLDADATMARAAGVLFDLVIQRAAAVAAGVPNAAVRYSLSPMTIRVMRTGRVWFADGPEEASSDVAIDIKLEQLRRMLDEPLPDLAPLATALPEVPDLRAAAAALM